MLSYRSRENKKWKRNSRRKGRNSGRSTLKKKAIDWSFKSTDTFTSKDGFMQPIPQTNTRQNKRARKLHSSRPWHLERSRVSIQISTGWSPQHILRWKKTTHRVINQTVNLEEDTQRCHFAPVPKIAADTSTA